MHQVKPLTPPSDKPKSLFIFGFLLVGKSLASNLKKVSARKAPEVFWRMLWNGTTDIPPDDLKAKKPKKDKSQDTKLFWNRKHSK